MSDDARRQWRRALEPGPDCVPLDRIGDELVGAEREHLAACARCQAERAVWDSVNRAATDPADVEATQWVAAETRRRVSAPAGPSRVAGRAWRVPSWIGIAAGLILLAGAAVLWRDTAPGIGAPPAGNTVVRSGAVQLGHPIGDIDVPPRQFSWSAVDGAVRYSVTLLEVDGTELWVGTAEGPAVELPLDVSSKALPAKTLVWEVVALDRNGAVLARSNAGRFRVKAASVPSGR